MFLITLFDAVCRSLSYMLFIARYRWYLIRPHHCRDNGVARGYVTRGTQRLEAVPEVLVVDDVEKHVVGGAERRQGEADQVESTPRVLRAIMTSYLLLKGKGRKEMFYLTTHSTHFIYGYMASYIW